MVEPGDEWPEHPTFAVYHASGDLFDPLVGHGGHAWITYGVPPDDFPFVSAPYPRALFGPPGTVWVFSLADLAASLVHLPGRVAQWLVRGALNKLGIEFTATDLGIWRVPDPRIQPEDPTVTFRYLRTTIVGSIGTVEQVAHVLNWRPAAAPDGDLSVAQVQAHGDAVRDHWALFMAPDSPAPVSGFLSSSLKYTEVSTSYLEQGAAATITTHPGRRGPVKDFHYPRPTVLVPTQFSNFVPNQVVGHSTQADLPWEVALCLSLQTGLRGPRNRGRLYLGPLGQGLMAAGGVFSNQVQDIASAFVSQFLNPTNAATQRRLMVVSRAYATALPVTGVAVGHVPDSQRRRRKKQPELPTAAVGVA